MTSSSRELQAVRLRVKAAKAELKKAVKRRADAERELRAALLELGAEVEHLRLIRVVERKLARRR